MRKFLPILCIAILAAIPSAAARQKGPVLEFESLSKAIDKVVFDGEIITTVFKFTNKGDAVLEIKDVQPSCGCTSAVPTPNKLAPGRNGSIEIKITTASLTAGTGKKTDLAKTVTVTSNDPKNPILTLTITGVVAPEISLSEPSIWFGSNAQGREITKEMFADIAADRDVKILAAKSEDPWVTVSLQPMPGNDKRVKIILTQKADAPPGIHSGEVVLKTTSQVKPLLSFTVRGLVAKNN
jgi:hypothetical protein